MSITAEGAPNMEAMQDAPVVEWAKMTAPALVDAARDDAIVLLPVASTEQHGPHLATGCDALLGAEVCRRTALTLTQAGTRAIVAPAVWMGLAEHHVAFGGTFTLALATWNALVRDLCRSILRASFKRIVIVNAHGGNIAALQALSEELTRELEAPIAYCTYPQVAEADGLIAPILEDQDNLKHACEAETSMMMALVPDLVDGARLSEAYGPMETMLSKPLNRWRSFAEMTESGVRGDARRASAEKGERLFDACAQAIASRLQGGEPWR